MALKRKSNNKMKGLQKVLESKDPSRYYKLVIKQSAESQFEFKQKAYPYIALYSSRNQDLVLLSISFLQRDLKDKDHRTRLIALKTLIDLTSSTLSNVVLAAIEEMVEDSVKEIRLCAVKGLFKVWELDGKLEEKIVGLCKRICEYEMDVQVFGEASLCLGIASNEWPHLKKIFNNLLIFNPSLQSRICTELVRYFKTSGVSFFDCRIILFISWKVVNHFSIVPCP